MKFRLRVFIVIALVAGLAAWQLYASFREQLKPALQQATEDVLVDTGAALALLAERDLQEGRLGSGRLVEVLRELPGRPLQAHIWGHARRASSIGVYVTDARGIVLFDSAGARTGLDYSRWNDVYLTLQGKYGARSSRAREDDVLSSVMYVGTPLYDASGAIRGVLTVYKPVQSLRPFLERGEEALSRQALLVLLAALLLGMVMAWWLARGIGRLVNYADTVARGGRQPLPATGSSELDRLAAAMDHMRSELDGRRQVEGYVQALTHELKSPLAAIAASAELLQDEGLPEEARRRFAGSIGEQGRRAGDLIERLLHLVRLESRQSLEQPLPVDLVALWHTLRDEAAPRLAQRQLEVDESLPASAVVLGDAFLLRLALGNLLENAIAFSPAGSRIEVRLEAREGRVVLQLRDQGAGIPDYALPQVFERFYSLPRPDGSPRSSGLGLPLVREIAQLHGGSISVGNHAGGGAVATLILPS
ncbi:MAG: two-component sensor histidine kinase [Moraxellaceae bacterium]|nr:two-component sensor histidine kinase [Moraxellaceae bacterium]